MYDLVERLSLDVRLEALPVDHIHRDIKQAGNILFQPYIIENAEVRSRIEVDHKIEIAVRPRLSTRYGTEQGNMCDTLLIQLPPMLPQRGYDPISFHDL